MKGSSEGRGARSTLLVASDDEWFAESLTSVLRPRLLGVSVEVVGDREALMDRAAAGRPNLLIVDRRLVPPGDTGRLCQELVEGTLGRHTPLLVYNSGGAQPELEAEVLGAGAWGVLYEPLRSEILLARVARFLEVATSLREVRRGDCIDEETGLFELPFMLETIPLLTSLARRRRTSLSCTVIGPTRPASGSVAEEQRRVTARVCVENVRSSDLSGWADGENVAIVTFDAPVKGAETVVHRLDALAREAGGDERDYSLSAGIVEMESGEGEEEHPAERSALEPDETLAAARSALEEAREAGGGIRVAAVA